MTLAVLTFPYWPVPADNTRLNEMLKIVSWQYTQAQREIGNIASLKNIYFKAALINIFILTLDEMTMCNVKGLVCSGQPTENYHHLSLQSPSPLQSFLVSFSTLFWFALHATNPAPNCRQTKLATSW